MAPALTPAQGLAQGPGGPILVVTSTANPFTQYYAEILRAEGFNEFSTADISTVSATTLAAYDLVILGDTPLTAAQVTIFTNWVNAGGSLIAMHPDKQLASLLGISNASATLSNAYLQVNQASGPGIGIVSDTIQFHGTADLYTRTSASSVALLYSDFATPTVNPAVTLNNVGISGGQAAAFTFDLARSVVYTRQGNPAWSGQERDGFPPIRSNDLFFGAASFDPRPDWVDLNKVQIPQADEQQRLLANMILQMNAHKRPLPRFWYFPRGYKAVVVMTGDDHANGGTAGRFDQYKSLSTTGCSVANWECVRGTSYIYPNTPLTNAQAVSYVSQGFEVALHVNTNCADWTPTSLAAFYTNQLSSFASAYPGVPRPTTNRTHCIAWSDYATQPQVELNNSIRLDTSYYYWPSSWITDRPGMFTGSGMPMRFSDLNGNMIDVYQATTQMTDESGQSYPAHINVLLDNALGSKGFFGAFTVNAHTDSPSSAVSDAVVSSAQSRNVPIITSQQMLTWVDGRNTSSFGSIAWSGNSLSFTVSAAAGANGLQAMLPTSAFSGSLNALRLNGSPVTYTVQQVKGISYAFFPVAAGSYQATYTGPTTPPVISAVTSSAITFSSASISWTTDQASDSQVEYGTTTAYGNITPLDGSSVTSHVVPLTGLAASTTYHFRVKSRGIAGTVAVSSDSTFTTGVIVCPCTVWSSSAVPVTQAAADPNPVELGLVFTSELNGFVTGVRFYKSTINTGQHIGNLWSTTGTRLASAVFTSETPSGWQQVNFATPVPITANTMYIVSYHTQAGNYADDEFYFSRSGVDSPPLHALSDNAAAGNGVYSYGASQFPVNTFQAANYWVDAVFNLQQGSGNPVPTTTGLNPTGALSGGPAFTLTVNGSSFLSSSVVRWNGSDRTTTFVNSAQLTAAIPASDIAAAGTAAVTVFNPAPGGGISNAQTFTINTNPNPVPSTTNISPVSAPAGGAGFTLTVNGSNFVNGASVRWNGASRTTTFVSSTQVTAAIPASDIAAAGTATVTVFNPAPGGGTSNGQSFTINPPPPTWKVSGIISPAAAITGTTITITGGPSSISLTTSAAADGSYSFSGLLSGSYVVTPQNTNYSFSPASQNVTVNGSDVSSVNFTGTALPTQTLFTSQTPVDLNATDGPGVDYELGLRFKSDINGNVTAVRFWKSSSETGVHTGKIWTGAGQLLASTTFVSESASGWQQQAFSSVVPISANTEYVISVNTGNTFYVATNNALASPVINSHLQSIAGNNGVYGSPGQFPTSSFQSTNYFRDLVFASGPTFSLSGAISPAGDGSGTTIALSGVIARTATADAAGNYNFTGLPNGSYTLTPSKPGFVFSPSNQTLTISGGNLTAATFTISPKLAKVSGTISPSSLGAGATVNLTGAVTASATADNLGNYSFTGLRTGTYQVMPSKPNVYFSPLNQSVSLSGTDVSGVNFTAAAAPGGTFTISGSVSPLADAPGTIVSLTGVTSGSATLDSTGAYSFSGLPSGSYTVTPTKSFLRFSPSSRSVSISTASLSGINFTSQHQKAFTANSDSNNVTAIDLVSNTVVGTASVGVQPFGVAISPDGATLFATNFTSSTLTVINTATLARITELFVGANPVGVTFSPDGSVAYVANQGGNSVSVVNSATLIEETQIPVGSNPIWVAFTPDGRFAYVTNQVDFTVSVINTSTRRVTATIVVGAYPTAVAISPNGSRAYVTNAGANTVSVINTATNSVVATINNTGAHAQGNAITPDGRLMYVTEDAAYDVIVVDTSTNAVVKTIPVAQATGLLGPDGVDFSSNGAFAYIANRGANSVSVIDVASGTVVKTIAVGLGPAGIVSRP